MRRFFRYVLILVFASSFTAHAARAESMTCDDNDRRVATHDYASSPEDVLQPSRLELTRPFDASGTLEIHVCEADLHVQTDRNAKGIKLTVDLRPQSAHGNLADYIQTIRIQPDSGVIQLKFPKEAHATVTLIMPMGPNSTSKFNLGKGDLDFNAIGGAGTREINVGMGHMRLLLDDEKSYSTMNVNVGMGSLHDHRPGGRDGHFVVSRDYQGHGSGSLEINVGMGSLDIHND